MLHPLLLQALSLSLRQLRLVYGALLLQAVALVVLLRRLLLPGVALLHAVDTDIEYGHMAFWHDRRTTLPRWHALVLDVALMQPSSAFMERVFSILRCCFSERQESVYSDRMCAATLLKYNRGRDRSKGTRTEVDDPGISTT